MAEEEDIDTETIQAQIDLSMSITNDLVSSWLKPSNKPKTPYNQALEAELKEHMRKPPRLGVGASIPESISVSSREMARLKGSLVGKGKKRSREEEGESSHKLSSDDEGESRAGAIRKKTIPNPFTMPTPKKKKSSQADDAMNGESGASVKPSGKPSSDTTDYTLLAPSRGIFSQHDASQNKKLMNADQGHRSRGSSPPLLATNLEELKVRTVQESSKQTSKSLPSSPLTTRPHSRGPKSQSDAIHTILNLNGLIGDPEANSDSDEAGASPSKSKKKRKRKKKKKKAHVIGTEGGSAEVSKSSS